MTAQSAAGMSHHKLLRAQQQETRSTTSGYNLKIEPAPWLADAKASVLQSSIEGQRRRSKQRASVRCMAQQKGSRSAHDLWITTLSAGVGNLTD
jgi:hypothetical protein